MSSANVVKNDNMVIEMITLESREQQKLKKDIVGYGNMARVKAALQLDQFTIRKAANGGKIRPATAKKIRAYLNPATDEQ